MKSRPILLLLALLFLGISNVNAQDRLITKTGQYLLVKVVKVTGDKVLFEKHGVSSSPTYEYRHAQVDRILYGNGSVDYFSEEDGLVMLGGDQEAKLEGGEETALNGDTPNVASRRVSNVGEKKVSTRVVEEKISFEEELIRANRMGRNLFSAKVHFNNREAKRNGWLPLFPLFDGAFANFAFSYERVSENGLLSMEIPVIMSWGKHRAKEMGLEDFVDNPEVDVFEAADLLQSYQVENYQQVALRFKIFPNGQEQVTYFIGPFITASRGDYGKYIMANSEAHEMPILELETTSFYSAAAGIHNGISLSPANFITFNLGGGLGLQIFNTAEKGFERAPAYYLDFGLGLRF